MLRDYQQRSIDQLYAWFQQHDSGHPCLVLPTGAGKSHIVAALCKNAVQSWPQTRILMLTGQKELIEQNAEKMRQHWPGAPLGIYSAAVGKRQLGQPITFAGIQSVAKKAHLLGHQDIVIVDECHQISHKEEGAYRTLINALLTINPALRVIGLTATPYRLGHGLITDKPALFDDLIEPVTVEELIHKGYLATLRSKVTTTQLDTTGVHKRGGEYIESELQKAVDTSANNIAVVDEVIARAEGRRSWLFFCTGVEHSEHIRDVLRARGVTAETVTGATPKGERERIIADFKAGRIQALTNAAVLTTGFDSPNIDLIVLLRPTMSASLYIQMVGRGLRLKDHTDHCLVLDFAGAVAQHGPITAVKPPKKAGSGNGEAPVKACDQCHELVHTSVRVCPACGHEFPPPKEHEFRLHTDDIMGVAGTDMEVSAWTWRAQVSRKTGVEMLMVSYYGGLSDPPVSEYICINHEGYAGHKAARTLAEIARAAGVDVSATIGTCAAIAGVMQAGKPPRMIEYKREGKYHRIIKREWNEQPTNANA